MGVASTVSNSLTGIAGIIGKAIATRQLKKESERQRLLAEDLLAQTAEKPVYELTPETMAREDYYRNIEQGAGPRFRWLGQAADEQLARTLRGLGESATSGAQLSLLTTGARDMARDSRKEAIMSGMDEIDRAAMSVNNYVGQREGANEMNWGVRLGDVLRKEQLGYDYLGASEQNRLNRLYALSQLGASAAQVAKQGADMIGSGGKASQPGTLQVGLNSQPVFGSDTAIGDALKSYNPSYGVELSSGLDSIMTSGYRPKYGVSF